jgi:hypothetical protein
MSAKVQALHWDRGRLARLKQRLHPSAAKPFNPSDLVFNEAG